MSILCLKGAQNYLKSNPTGERLNRLTIWSTKKKFKIKYFIETFVKNKKHMNV